MPDLPSYRYVLITPARNEAPLLELTIRSVLAQVAKPTKWIIVDDGSTDGTAQLVTSYTNRFDWIELVRTQERNERHFAGKVHAFACGFARLKGCQYEIIGNLDADISFSDPQYFSFLLRQFANNPKLGICGTAYCEGNVTYPSRLTSRNEVFGACQMFRRTCFESIGGYRPLRGGGIDVIAVLEARARGWETRTFTEKICEHHRKVGSAVCKHPLLRTMDEGKKDYLLGNHPFWELLRSLYRMTSKPFIAGGLFLFSGYLVARLRKLPRVIPPDLMTLRRTDQMRRLGFAGRRFLALRIPLPE